jgi:hypothetical protein
VPKDQRDSRSHGSCRATQPPTDHGATLGAGKAREPGNKRDDGEDDGCDWLHARHEPLQERTLRRPTVQQLRQIQRRRRPRLWRIGRVRCGLQHHA